MLWGRVFLQCCNRGRSERLATNLFFKEDVKIISSHGRMKDVGKGGGLRSEGSLGGIDAVSSRFSL